MANRQSQKENEQQFWTAIQYKDSNEYDCVPSCWLISDNVMRYPMGAKNVVTKLAKECAEPEGNWPEEEVVIKKRNYPSYKRCMDDVMRFSGGKKSLSSSEAESRGPGQRLYKRPERLSPSPVGVTGKHPSSCSAENAKDAAPSSSRDISMSSPERSRKTPPESSQFLSFATPVESMAGSIVTTPDVSTPVDRRQKKTPSSSARRRLFTKNVAPTCKIKKYRHKCAFSQGHVSLASLTHSVCALARTQETILNLLKEVKEKQLEGTAEDDGEEVNEEECLEVSSRIPASSLNELDVFESELRNPQFFQKAILLLKNKTSKTNIAKSAIGVVKLCLKPCLAEKFSWKGLSGGKRSFVELRLKTVIFRVVKELYPKTKDIEPKIEVAVSRYLAQTASNLKKGRGKPATPPRSQTPHLGED